MKLRDFTATVAAVGILLSTAACATEVEDPASEENAPVALDGEIATLGGATLVSTAGCKCASDGSRWCRNCDTCNWYISSSQPRCW